MTAPLPFITFPGTTRQALGFYAEVFGGALELVTRREMGVADEPADAIQFGQLAGPVSLLAADAAGGEVPVQPAGLILALLGVAAPDVLTAWFRALAADGHVIDDLQQRPWGDVDGVVRDRFGVTWLIGYQASGSS